MLDNSQAKLYGEVDVIKRDASGDGRRLQTRNENKILVQ